MHLRPGRARTTTLAILCVVAALGLGSGLAYRFSPWFRSLFGHDAENPQEMKQLAETTADGVPEPADPTVGWPQWRGPFRDGRPPKTPLRTDWEKVPPKQLWSVPCGGGYSSFAVVGGKIYTQDKQGGNERVLCINEDGQLLWDHAYPAAQAGRDRNYGAGPRATPTIEGNRLYAVGGSGKFLCLELPATASEKPRLAWEHDLLGEFQASLPQWGVACSPLVEGNLVIVQPGGKDGSVVAFDKASGEVRWKAGSNVSGYSSPVAATIGDVRVIYAFTGHSLLCIRAADGTITGTYPWRTQYEGNIATPIVVKDWVFISSAYGKGCALLRAIANGDAVTFEEVYARNNRVLMSHHSTAVYKDWHLFGFSGDSRAELRCVDFKKGLEVPGWEAAGVDKGSLILVGNHLLILTQNGELILAEANPAEYRELGRMRTGLGGGQVWALPIVVDGRLYVRDNKKVICFDVRP